MLDKLYDNIGAKIKQYVKTATMVAVLGGLLMLVISASIYADNKEYIKFIDEFRYSSLRESAMTALAAKNGIKYSIILIITSIISSWPLYGLGQLIENTDMIVKHLSGPTPLTPSDKAEPETALAEPADIEPQSADNQSEN